MSEYRLAVIPGDGVGKEVVAAALMALEAAAEAHGFAVTTEHYDLGGERYLRTGEVLPESVQEELAGFDAILLGAVGMPGVPPGVLERGLLLKLRFDFDQYVNLRPVKLYDGVPTPVEGLTPDRCDLVVVRENTEGLYAGAGGFQQSINKGVAILILRAPEGPSGKEPSTRWRPRSRSTRGWGWSGSSATPSRRRSPDAAI